MPSSDHLCWNHSNLNFSEYLAWTEQLIKARRCDLTPKNQDTIIAANQPFELLPSNQSSPQKGILLIHGLLSSPVVMQDIGQHLQQQNFLVRSILLPGHGTRPGDLKNVSVEDWIEAVEFGINSLKQEVDHVWIGGLSGGADLALYAAYKHKDVKGLLLFAPSFKLKNIFSPLIPLVNAFNKKWKFNYWPDIGPENDYAKYDSFPVYFAAQAYKLTKIIRNIMKKQAFPCPTWMVLTEDDETICSNTAKKIFLSKAKACDHLIWYGKKASVSEKQVSTRSSHFAAENILNFSHACLTTSAQNTHYGVNGDYLPPLYRPTTPLMDMTEHYGALSKDNLNNYTLRRLLYNPDFSALMGEMDKFITATEAQITDV